MLIESGNPSREGRLCLHAYPLELDKSDNIEGAKEANHTLSRKLNHHFVPQFHFRLMTGGRRYIHLASRDGARFVHFASVKGQCARHKFYGNENLEDWLGNLEQYHSTALRYARDFAWGLTNEPLSDSISYRLREAVMLQRARTPRAARMMSTSSDQMMLYSYREYLAALPHTPARQAEINAIDNGTAIIADTEFAHLMMSLNIATRTVTAISDLSLLILRNQTTYPFILGDAPAVLSNHYMREIRNMGVLGFLTPGLIAVMPIDAKTQLLFYDAAVYTPDYSSAGCIDLVNRSDVSQLNALQIHASENNIYFADIAAEEYIRELLAAHASLLQKQSGRFIVHGGSEVLIAGVPNTGKVLHIFEPQLPITLNLSCFTTAPLPRNETPNRPRNPMIAKQVQQALGIPENPSPLPIDEFARWMRSQIRYSEGT
jgi:hypothetical protein